MFRCFSGFTKRLQDNCYEAHLALGTFYLDTPDSEYFEDVEFEDEDNLDNNGIPFKAHTPVHYWVLIIINGKRFICDITSDQFTDECAEEQPEIMLAEEDAPEAWRYHLLQVDPDHDLTL